MNVSQKYSLECTKAVRWFWYQQSIYGGKICWKSGFWARNEKEKELWMVKVMIMKMNYHEWEEENETDEMKHEVDSRVMHIQMLD